MATTIDEWRTKAFAAESFMLAQQKFSRFIPYVTMRNETSNHSFLPDHYGIADDPVAVTERAPATPRMNYPKYRTAYFQERHEWAGPYIDSFDKPTIDEDELAVQRDVAAASIGRYIDRLILGRAYNLKAATTESTSTQGLFGTRYTGELGTTPSTFPTTAYSGTNASAAYVIPVDLGGTAVGLTPQKLLAVQEIFRAREVLQDGDMPILAVSARQFTNLKNSMEFVSSDIAAQAGRFENDMGATFNYMGFTFIHSQQAPLDGSSYRRVPVWIKRYLHLGTWGGDSAELLSDVTRSNAQFWLFKFSKAATRLHDEGFVEILCSEA